jgi:hypothetical protein
MKFSRSPEICLQNFMAASEEQKPFSISNASSTSSLTHSTQSQPTATLPRQLNGLTIRQGLITATMADDFSLLSKRRFQVLWVLQTS